MGMQIVSFQHRIAFVIFGLSGSVIFVHIIIIIVIIII